MSGATANIDHDDADRINKYYKELTETVLPRCPSSGGGLAQSSPPPISPQKFDPPMWTPSTPKGFSQPSLMSQRC
ncbi:hypothetical protein ElyMa_006962100 [Elysia marginata]|uniref:Uncharacterized protein n=1 Tax=Elysia marginata TaxID=1093978 RepID=A0AAV4JKB7_9GAST|nr:hypothetical protein ElyMa_006962100 [Elysia marginata]